MPSEQPASLSLTSPATKQYEITSQIGDVSVTVRAPSAAECEQMVARLDKSAESRELEPHETAVVDTLRKLAEGIVNKSAFVTDIERNVRTDRFTKFTARIAGEHRWAEVRWEVKP